MADDLPKHATTWDEGITGTFSIWMVVTRRAKKIISWIHD